MMQKDKIYIGDSANCLVSNNTKTVIKTDNSGTVNVICKTYWEWQWRMNNGKPRGVEAV